MILGYFSDGRPIIPIRGADPRGISTAGDLLTLDGVSTTGIFNEFQTVLSIVNEQRSAVTALLTFGTTRPLDAVAQTVDEDAFQVASEFGAPTSFAARPDVLKLGYDMQDFDLAKRMTRRYLRDATAEEIEALHARAIHADNTLTTSAVLRRLLTPTAGVNDEGNTVYPLWNGTAGEVPPKSGFTTHTAPHQHYLTTGSAAVDGEDLDTMANHIRHHGYASTPGSQLVLFCNPADLPALVAIRAGVSGADYDFIPAAGAPAFLSSDTIVGERAPAEYNRLKVTGSYGDVWILPTDFQPPGYLLMAATGGPNGAFNAVGFREHPSAAQRGLLLLPGDSRYPLVDSVYVRTFGVGVRHRGAAVAMQITTAGTYTAPTL